MEKVAIEEKAKASKKESNPKAPSSEREGGKRKELRGNLFTCLPFSFLMQIIY